MCEPETAVRCVREVAFMASARSVGTSRSSPIAMPGTRPRASRGRVRQAADRARWVFLRQVSRPAGRFVRAACLARMAPTEGASAAKLVSRFPLIS